jgi:hypothetical protein
MTKLVGFSVQLQIPDSMTPEQAEAELRTAISFGRPEISRQYVTTLEENT